MKISEYRDSGILQAYVLGVLDDNRTDQLLKDLETNVALRRELEEVEQNLASFKRNFTKKRGPSKTSGKITQKNSGGGKTKSGTQKLILGILIVLIIGLVFLFLSTIYERAGYQLQLSESLELIDSQQSAMDNITLKKEVLGSGFANLIEEASETQILRGVGMYHSLNAAFFEDRKRRQLLLYLSELPVLSEGQIIQLWGRSENEWRRAGLISWEEVESSNPPAFFLFPMGNIIPEMATVESQLNPATPDLQSILFR